MKDKCKCNDFDEKEDTFGKSLRFFNVIASSNIINDGNELKVDHTKIMKCRNCNSYYIWNTHGTEYYENDKISMKKYSPKTDDDGLRKVLGEASGVIDEKDIDSHSELLEKIRDMHFNDINEIYLDENKN
jgi:hypothetical protein